MDRRAEAKPVPLAESMAEAAGVREPGGRERAKTRVSESGEARGECLDVGLGRMRVNE